MVSSRPGQGTTFSVYLPPLLASEEEVEQGESTPAIRGRGETVLLVEDEPAVLAVTKSLLLHLGYQVLTANNGREALLVYAEHQDVIALVLSDVVMPDMDGVALFEALTAENPVIKIVLMSGYPLVEDGAELLAKGVVNWFQKPVSEVELSQILSKFLGTSL
jgi:CheY-like chemotaxis protein